MVSPWEYFWSKSKNVVVKKGSKRTPKVTLVQGTIPNHIIWKRVSTDVRQEALEIVAAMGAFAGENCDYVSSMNKEIEMKE